MAKSPAGKKKSSLNRMSHGVRSCVLIMEDERQEDYEAVERGWLETYDPQDYRERRLVDQLIVNDWFLQRAMRRLAEAEQGDREAEGYEHRVALMQRYKTTAERAFYRAFGAVESMRKELTRTEGELKSLREEIAELKRRRAEERPVKAEEKTSKSAKARPIALAEQWIEVTIDEEGKTVTELFPSNEELREAVEKLDPKRDLVYRRFHFVNGVPDEYAWTTAGLKLEEQVRELGGAGIPRMSPERWFLQIEKEKRHGNGHLLPCGGNIPRPEERGGCDCEVCSENRALMEEQEDDW